MIADNKVSSWCLRASLVLALHPMTHKHGSSRPTWGRVISARKWLSVWLMRQSVFRPFRPFGCLITSVSRLNPSNQPARGSCTGLLSRDLPSIRMSTWSPIPQTARNAGGMRMPRELPIFRMQVRMSRLWPRSACKSPSAGYWPGYIIASSSPWLAELNAAIRSLVLRLNTKPFRKRLGSRAEVFATQPEAE